MNLPAIDCPNCLPPKTVTNVEIMTEPETQTELLRSDATRPRELPDIIVGWRLLPCGHTFLAQDWLLICDELGTRVLERKRVLLVDVDGTVIPA